MQAGALTLLTIALLVVAPLASAQTGDSASMSGAARDLFQEGVTAAREDRLEDAIEAFERSYSLSPRDATLLNLAQVQERAGHLVGAIDSYRRFLARADADMLARHGTRAEAALAALEPRIAHLAIMTFDVEADDEVRLDGAVLERASFGLDLPVDPSAHVVTVHRGEVECAHETVTLQEGGRRDLEVRMRCPAEARVVSRRVASPPSGSDDTPWIALGVGGGVAVVAAIIIGIVVASAPPPATPFMGNVGPGSFVGP